MIGLRRFGAPNIEGFDQSIQQIIIVKSIDLSDGLSDQPPPPIGRDTLFGDPHPLRQLAGLPEHVGRHVAHRLDYHGAVDLEFFGQMIWGKVSMAQFPEAIPANVLM
jgi:hypothetical protein